MFRRSSLFFGLFCLGIGFLITQLPPNWHTSQSRLDSELFLAASLGHEPLVKQLLAKGARPFWRDPQNNTTVVLAADKNHWHIVALLLEKEPSLVTQRGAGGNFLLHSAAFQGRDGWVKKLVTEYKAPLDSQNDSGSTPLHHAAYEGRFTTVKTLVELGASIKTVNDYKETPLHVAAWQGHAEVARYLVEKGSDTEARARQGETVSDYAAKRGHREMLGLFSKKPALRAKGQARTPRSAGLPSHPTVQGG